MPIARYFARTMEMFFKNGNDEKKIVKRKYVDPNDLLALVPCKKASPNLLMRRKIEDHIEDKKLRKECVL